MSVPAPPGPAAIFPRAEPRRNFPGPARGAAEAALGGGSANCPAAPGLLPSLLFFWFCFILIFFLRFQTPEPRTGSESPATPGCGLPVPAGAAGTPGTVPAAPRSSGAGPGGSARCQERRLRRSADTEAPQGGFFPPCSGPVPAARLWAGSVAVRRAGSAAGSSAEVFQPRGAPAEGCPRRGVLLPGSSPLPLRAGSMPRANPAPSPRSGPFPSGFAPSARRCRRCQPGFPHRSRRTRLIKNYRAVCASARAAGEPREWVPSPGGSRRCRGAGGVPAGPAAGERAGGS